MRKKIEKLNKRRRPTTIGLRKLIEILAKIIGSINLAQNPSIFG